MKQIKISKNIKKNRKGFTLVELLAVIVILAIVVGITLVTVLPALKDSRQEAFELSAQIAADYLEKQYQLSQVGISTDESLKWDVIVVDKSKIKNYPRQNITIITPNQIKAAGLKPENYVLGLWYIDSTTGRACVILHASTKDAISQTGAYPYLNLAGKNEAGEYYDVTSMIDTRHSAKGGSYPFPLYYYKDPNEIIESEKLNDWIGTPEAGKKIGWTYHEFSAAISSGCN